MMRISLCRSFFLVLVSCSFLFGVTSSNIVHSQESKKIEKKKRPTRGYRSRVKELTKESRLAIEKGLEYLKTVQNEDGGCGVDVNQGSDIACSCLVGMTYLIRGIKPIDSKEGRALKRILDFILHKVDVMPAVDITAETRTQVQSKIGRHAHSFFAALFLSQIYGEASPEDNKRIALALKKLTETICRAQQQDGAWGGRSWAPVLGTVMGWESLQGSSSVGLKISASDKRAAQNIIQQMRNNLNQQQRGNWMHTLYKNASGVRVCYSMGLENDPTVKRSWKSVLSLVTTDNTPFTQAGGEEFLAFHLLTQCMAQRGGKSWEQWYPTVRDKLVLVQNADGSWTGHHCITSRTFCTACAVLVLSSWQRYLPISDI